MASSYYSEHFQTTQGGAVTAAATGHRASASVSHGRKRSKVASFLLPIPVTADRLYLFKIRSGDTPTAFLIQNFDLGTDCPGTIGLEKEDGTVVDADFFIADVVLETARTIPTAIIQAVALTDATHGDLGKPIWKLLGLSANPFLTYNVILVVGTVSSGAAGGVFFELQYNAGD
jgi:hypothetical protein